MLLPECDGLSEFLSGNCRPTGSWLVRSIASPLGPWGVGGCLGKLGCCAGSRKTSWGRDRDRDFGCGGPPDLKFRLIKSEGSLRDLERRVDHVVASTSLPEQEGCDAEIKHFFGVGSAAWMLIALCNRACASFLFQVTLSMLASIRIASSIRP